MLAIGLLMKKNLLYHFKDVSGNSDKIEKITMRRRQQENMIEKQQETKIRTEMNNVIEKQQETKIRTEMNNA